MDFWKIRCQVLDKVRQYLLWKFQRSGKQGKNSHCFYKKQMSFHIRDSKLLGQGVGENRQHI